MLPGKCQLGEMPTDGNADWKTEKYADWGNAD
jgi:hypothetical protein